MKTSYQRSIEEFLRSSMAGTAEKEDYSYEEQLRYEVAAALEPSKQYYNYKKKDFLEV